MVCVRRGQLLYDRDAWLLRRFDPPVRLFSAGTESLYQADQLCEDAAYSADGAPYCAVALPQDAVLLKTLQLPTATEEDLDAAMALEIDLSSPFSDQDTRAAWRVLSRGESIMEVVLAITAQSAIDETLQTTEFPSENGVAEAPEVWALSDSGIPISFTGFGGQTRRQGLSPQVNPASGIVGSGLDVCHGRPDGHRICHLASCRSFGCDVSAGAREAADAAKRRQELELGRTRLGRYSRGRHC
jgi:hypothetical protein